MKKNKESFKKLMKVWKDKDNREEKDFVYRIYRKLYRLIHNGFYLSDLKRDIVAFIQRGKRGWSNRDVWELSDYISKTLAKTLLLLNKNHCGYPGDLTEGQWLDILNKMIDTFETAYKIAGGEVYYIPTKEWNEIKYRQMLHYIESKGPIVERVLSKKQSKEFEEGFALFQKYFFSLWD